MSTGAECKFYEKESGKWYYDLQRWPYGECLDYDTHGPFSTFKAADDHLRDNYANPGGYSVKALPGCPHDLITKRDYHTEHPYFCNRCGAFLKAEDK